MNIVQILLAFVAYYLHGHDKSIYKSLSSSVLSSSNRAKFLESFPNCDSLFSAMSVGDEIDWDVLLSDSKAYLADYRVRPTAKSSWIQTIALFMKWFKSGSAGSLVAIRKLSASIEDSSLRSLFVGDSVDQGAIRKSLKEVVTRLGGDPESMTVDTSAKDVDPDAFKEYRRLRTEYNQAWKDELSNFVRSSGERTVPMRDLEKHFKKNGIEHSMSKGFTGNIDANGVWYTQEGQAISGVPGAAMFPEVKMNPNYGEDSPFVFQAIRSNGELGPYSYTQEYVHNAARKKFQKVQSFNVEATRKKWLPMLKAFNPEAPDMRSVSAIIMEILYLTSNRIGSRPTGNAQGGGFGIASLQVRHFFPQADGSVKFIYLGKDDVRTVAKIPNTDPISKAVCAAVYSLVEGKKSRDPIFSYALKNGTFKIVQSSVVNAVFRGICGVPGLTVHKLRTARGSRMFQAFLDKTYSKYAQMDMKTCLEILKKGGTLVGKELNHVRRASSGVEVVTPATALKNYIDPFLQAQLFQHYQLPVPTVIEKMVSEDAGSSSGLKASVVRAHALRVLASEMPTNSEEEVPEDLIKDDEVTEDESDDSTVTEEVHEDEVEPSSSDLENIHTDEALVRIYDEEGPVKTVLVTN